MGARETSLAIVLGQFEQVAELVAERTSELLSAPVTVTNERGIVLASTGRHRAGQLFHAGAAESGPLSLRVPFEFDAQAGEVIVAGLAHDEVISPRLARVLVDLVINQTVVVARLPHQHELKRRFIQTLLRGTISDESEMMREGQVLGLDLTPTRAVILIDAAAYILEPRERSRPDLEEAEVQRRAQLVIASVVNFFSLPNDTICAYIGDGEVAVLKASATHDLAAWTDHADPQAPGEVDQACASWANLTALKRAATGLLRRVRIDTGANASIGIGRYHPGIRGIARSYQDARAALSLGRRFSQANRVHCLDGLGVAAFVGVSDERTKIELATHLLSPLDHEPELFETLDVFFRENCSPSSTAYHLSIHRNTLGHRLDKITALTGLDPRRFDDAVQIRLALVLRALRAPVE